MIVTALQWERKGRRLSRICTYVHVLFSKILHPIIPPRQSAGGNTLYMQHLMGDYLKEYGKLVDGPEDENKGLGNLTAAAKVLSTGHKRGKM